MPARITIIGGGSNQWVPRLFTDIVQAKPLADVHIVLEDLDPERLSRMERYANKVIEILGVPATVSATTNQREALEGADYVVVNISTGGFNSMRHDLEIPARYGIHQSVGDTVGPGGIMRALRNIPIFVGIARDMEALCPQAWLLNLTNPMTALCRAVTSQTRVRAIGLCHELTHFSFHLALLLDVSFLELSTTITGVNHLPVITACDAAGDDGLAKLAQLLDHGDLDAELPLDLSEFGEAPLAPGQPWTKRALVDRHPLALELFRHTGGLPAAGDRHVAEFFPGFLTEESKRGARWGVQLTTIRQREADEARYAAELDRLLATSQINDDPSGEMVHTVISALAGELAFAPALPLNIPNRGQCPDLPAGVVVESICLVDGDGVRGRDVSSAPPLLAEQLRRVSASQELTLTAALSGRRDDVVAAMLADPLAGRLDYDLVVSMANEMIDATKAWLPQFA